MNITRSLLLSLLMAAPASAQTSIEIRPFVFGTVESFTAADTFDAVFGRTWQPFFGGGAQILVKDKYFVDVSASRLSETGQRAFISNGQKFRLGLPLTATIVPVEATVGYRFKLARSPHVRPYVAAGGGVYLYRESSDFSDPTASPPATGVDVDAHHVGFVANGGAEFRVHRWIAIDADVQYTYVPGILGNGGVSLQAGEKDLGGIAGRVKLVVGR